MFGCTECFLSDRGTNLFWLLGGRMSVSSWALRKSTPLPITHAQCDGVVECLNRTLNAELWKHVAKFGPQWDEFLFGMLWAYRNTLHESTKKKPHSYSMESTFNHQLRQQFCLHNLSHQLMFWITVNS